jgi:hypothetical protein
MADHLLVKSRCLSRIRRNDLPPISRDLLTSCSRHFNRRPVSRLCRIARLKDSAAAAAAVLDR